MFNLYREFFDGFYYIFPPPGGGMGGACPAAILTMIIANNTVPRMIFNSIPLLGRDLLKRCFGFKIILTSVKYPKL